MENPIPDLTHSEAYAYNEYKMRLKPGVQEKSIVEFVQWYRESMKKIGQDLENKQAES